MYPTILVTNNQKILEKHISLLKKTHDIENIQEQVIEPEKTVITIGQIRELRKDLTVSTSKPRFVIFNTFDSAKIEAQNALLKVLEELNTKTYFVMCVAQLGTILPTIISRSQVVYLEKNSAFIDDSVRHDIQSFLKSPSMKYASTSTFTTKTKDEASTILRSCIHIMREQMLAGNVKYTKIIASTLDLLYKLEHNNLSPQLTVDNFVLLAIKAKN